MATQKEIKEHLEIALKEVGKIKPWFDEEVNEWILATPIIQWNMEENPLRKSLKIIQNIYANSSDKD